MTAPAVPPRDPPKGTVELRGLEVAYGEHGAVHGVDLDVEAGRLTVLVGPSGCGKTSLLRAIAGFEVPKAGTVRIAGDIVAGPGIWVPPEKRRVGMVFQQGALFPHLDVWRNVLYGLEKSQRDREERAWEALRLVGMEARRDRFPDELSGGEQQRVALARALVPRPRLVLLDEPFASLDEALRRRLRDEVRSILHQAGATAVLVTHNQEEALSIADTLVVMAEGHVLQAGESDEVYHRPSTIEVARLLGEGQLVACEVSGGEARSLLGRTPCDADDGDGLLLVRPEDLALRPEGPAEKGRPGRVLERHFFGHDLIDEVDLGDGVRLRVRLLSSASFEVGAPVRVRLREKAFHVFPRSVLDDPGEATVTPLTDDP